MSFTEGASAENTSSRIRERDAVHQFPGTAEVFPNEQPGRSAAAFCKSLLQRILKLAGRLRGHLVLNRHMGHPGLRVLFRIRTADLGPCLATPSFECGGPDAKGDAEAEKNDAVEAKLDRSARPLDESKACDLRRRQPVEQCQVSGKEIPIGREVFAPKTIEPGEALVVDVCR